MPDKPVGFGYKTSWFAVRSSDPQAVADALGLPTSPVNWRAGIRAAYSYGKPRDAERQAFISPPVRGWVFVVSSALVYPDCRNDIGARFDRLFALLATRFIEVQFFGTYRVVGFDSWARARVGRIERVFSLVDGDVTANVGEQSEEERALGFADVSGLPAEDAGHRLFELAGEHTAKKEQLLRAGMKPAEAAAQLALTGRNPLPREEDTTALAGAWSVDPTHLESLDLAPGLGLLVTLPAAFRQ